MQKIKISNVKWTLKNKNLWQSHNLKPLKIYIERERERKFQCISKIHYESIIFLEFIQNIYDDSH
jgi:hypothetical protein